MNEKKSGVLILNKPYGITSHDVVNKIRRLYNTKKVGHTGTLDPMAVGVLPILVGSAVKASEYLVSDTKEYTAKMLLGIETDTEDTSGMTLSASDNIPEDITDTVNSFLGDYDQIPRCIRHSRWEAKSFAIWQGEELPLSESREG